MKITYAPIVSDVSGRFGGLVFSKWRGVRLARRFRSPANPSTADQIKVRNIFRNCNVFFIRQTSNVRAAWTAFAVGKDFTARNAYIGKQVPALNDDVNMDDFVGTPGDASTLAPQSMALVPGVTEIVATVTPPILPAGWTITAVHAYCVQDNDLSAAVQGGGHIEATASESPWECTLTSLPVLLFQIRGYIEWLAPDGGTRYSISLADTSTPTG